jgi:hypothetical protein
MEAFLQDVLFYAVLAYVAYVLLNGSSGGGTRDRLSAAA